MRTAWFLGGLGVGLIVGATLTFLEANFSAELKARNRYDEMLDLHRRMLDRNSTLNQDVKIEEPVEEEFDLNEYSFQGEEITVGGDIVVETPIAEEPIDFEYVNRVVEYNESDVFVNGTSPWSLEYIDAETYEEDDGRGKEQITILMGLDEPIFLMDGEQIDNWEELIGGDILKEFYQRVPPGVDRVLYVRNHRRDEDYEVVQDTP